MVQKAFDSTADLKLIGMVSADAKLLQQELN